MISNAETIFYTVTFLLPGFIIFYVKSRLVPQRIMRGCNSMFRYLFYSSINMLVSLPSLYFMQSSNYFIEKPEHIIFGWIAIVTVLPILLGIVSAIISSRGGYKKLLSKVCPTTLDEMPSAWDYKFSNLHEPRYVIVKLKDGSTVKGVYASKSHASAELEERDIYLEELFGVDKDGNWVEIINSDGVLLKSSEIVAIEFRKITGSEDKEINKSTVLKGDKKR